MENEHTDYETHGLKDKPYKKKSAYFILGFGWIFIILAVAGSIHLGASNVSYTTVWKSLFFYNADNPAQVIIHELRLPRAVAAAFVGAGLAVSGAIMQGITRNPLASPSILGVTSGSLFFMAIAFAFFPGISYQGLILVSFAGAGLGTVLVFTIAAAAKGGNIAVKLALAGAAITSLLSALSTAIGLRFNISKDLSYWYAGGVAGVQLSQLKYVIPAMIAGLLLALVISRSITLLSLGHDIAKGLGQNTVFVYIAGMTAVLLLTGAAVFLAGMVGFVGLIIPHVTRFLVGSDYSLIIPCSAILGALLLIIADDAAKWINAPFETPVGAVTAIIGVPFFLYLARKEGGGL
ncbi:FecCD family ABC transporter permease [Sporolactobacillus sp. KGMB 08714]|uniref:FecCD family ABC transporter permease n=1 Tax=Sporolactobacillus sp. KGMB 08714 TaxID=3064704 RepID=UPI002FBEB75C